MSNQLPMLLTYLRIALDATYPRPPVKGVRSDECRDVVPITRLDSGPELVTLHNIVRDELPDQIRIRRVRLEQLQDVTEEIREKLQIEIDRIEDTLSNLSSILRVSLVEYVRDNVPDFVIDPEREVCILPDGQIATRPSLLANDLPAGSSFFLKEELTNGNA